MQVCLKTQKMCKYFCWCFIWLFHHWPLWTVPHRTARCRNSCCCAWLHLGPSVVASVLVPLLLIVSSARKQNKTQLWSLIRQQTLSTKQHKTVKHSHLITTSYRVPKLFCFLQLHPFKVSFVSFLARVLWLKHTVCWVKSPMAGLLSEAVVFMTCQTSLLNSPKSD